MTDCDQRHNGHDDAAESDAEASHYTRLQERAVGTNINSVTLLTTDYLNHFNGFMMALEMMPSAPDIMAEEILSWEPITYEEHFRSSGFRDKDLAIEAFPHVPEKFSASFNSTVADLDQVAVDVRERVRDVLEGGETTALVPIAEDGVLELKQLIEVAGSIINGGIVEPADDSQSAVDALFE